MYTPPDDVATIEKLLKNLEEYFNDSDNEIDTTIKASLLQYQFEAIHILKGVEEQALFTRDTVVA